MLYYLEQNAAALVAAVFVFGLMVGSFLNVVIYRLPKMLEASWRRECQEFLGDEAAAAAQPRFNLMWPPSACPHCERRIRPWENIPILSYLALRGRCRGCGAAISKRYPIIELFTGIVSAAVAWRFGFSIEMLAALALTWALIAMSAIDIDHQILPDSITLPFLWLGLLLSLGSVFVPPAEAIIGAAAGYLSLWLVYHLFRLLTGKEGMGYGDFKLLALLGAWLGWQALPVVILLSSLVGAAIGITLIVSLGRDRNLPIPFGPYLAAAGWLALMWQDEIVAFYMQMVGLS